MPLDDVVEKIEVVPEEYRSLYVEGKGEQAGKFVLDMERIVNTVGLRKTNDALKAEKESEKRKREELEERFKGIDPDQVRLMSSRVQTDEDIKAILTGKTTFEAVMDKRMEKAREDDARRVTAAQQETDKWKARAAQLQSNALDGEIMREAGEAGIYKAAYRSAMLEAKADGFTLDDDGKVVMLTGDEVKRGKDGKSPFTLKEWFEERKGDRPHWWLVGNAGGGAGGGGRRGLAEPDWDKMTPAQKLTEARKLAASRKAG